MLTNNDLVHTLFGIINIFLKEIPGGVEMEDIIDYKVPMGILGQFVHPFLVRPKLDEIFEFRRKKLIEMFGEFKEK